MLAARLSNVVSGQQRVIRKWLGGALGSLLPSGALLAYDRTNSTSQLDAAAYYYESKVLKTSANFGNQHTNRAQGRFVFADYKKRMYKQDKVNTADSAFIFLIILLISQNRWSGWSQGGQGG